MPTLSWYCLGDVLDTVLFVVWLLLIFNVNFELLRRQLLDEMVDNGFPLAMELNVLQDLVKRPTFIRKIKGALLSESQL